MLIILASTILAIIGVWFTSRDLGKTDWTARVFGFIVYFAVFLFALSAILL